MKHSKSLTKFINRERSRRGKKNGVVKWLGEDLEDIGMNDKGKYNRNSKHLPQPLSEAL